MESNQEYKEKKEVLGEKVRSILTYVGIALAVIFSIAYIVVAVITIVGFEATLSPLNTVLLGLISAVFTIGIIQSLWYQGISFAKTIPENKNIDKNYNSIKMKLKGKEKQIHSITFYSGVNLIKSILTKGLFIVMSTWGILTIYVQGSGDVMFIALVLINIVASIGWGLIAMTNSYDKFIDEHVPNMLEKTARLQAEYDEKQKIKEAEKNANNQ